MNKYREGKGEKECEIITETECIQALRALLIIHIINGVIGYLLYNGSTSKYVMRA